jgi:hypothetical protein
MIVTTDHPDELVFTVAEETATPVARVPIEALGLTEVRHLQRWVLAHPEIIGSHVLVITFEFDRWSAPNAPDPRDRLDVLGLGADGRLVVAELKRGRVPDTVELQAIKYAAMASRFDEDQLVDLHQRFVRKVQGLTLADDEAREKVLGHLTEGGLQPELLLQPRIVLLAESFSPTVTSSVVWLNEQGVDITLRRYQAYHTTGDETVITVSQYYPVVQVASFEVRPGGPRTPKPDDLPEVPWSREDLSVLASLPFEVPHAVLDLCSAAPGTWIGSTDAYERAGVIQKSGMGRLAGFGFSVRSRFGRSNPPWETSWNVGGGNQQYYRVASEWGELRSEQEGALTEVAANGAAPIAEPIRLPNA